MLGAERAVGRDREADEDDVMVGEFLRCRISCGMTK